MVGVDGDGTGRGGNSDRDIILHGILSGILTTMSLIGIGITVRVFRPMAVSQILIIMIRIAILHSIILSMDIMEDIMDITTALVMDIISISAMSIPVEYRAASIAEE